MVTSINRKLATSAAALTAAVEVRTGDTWKPEDFVALAERVKAGVSGYMELVQTGSVAMLEHLAKHGNINVIKPMFEAAKSFNPGLPNKKTQERRDGSMARKWRGFIVAHSWLVYNPKNLKGAALASATFEDLWAKDRSRKMNIDAAKATKWFDYQLDRGASTKALAGVTLAEKIRKQVQALLNKRLIADASGKVLTPGRVKALIARELEKLEAPAKETVIAGVKATKGATVTAKGAKPRKASKVSGAPTAGAIAA